MDDADRESDDEESGGGAGFQLEALKSYGAFVSRAIGARKPVFFGVLLVGTALSILVMVFFPKTFSCTTVVLTVENRVLDGQAGLNPLAGATDMVMRKENLAQIVEDTGLVDKAPMRRPALLKLKDRIISAVFGETDRKSKVGALVGALESKLSVSQNNGSLIVTVNWADPVSTAELADAARESFLKARRSAEIAAFEEKMSILDEHATTLRGDIDTLAQQLQTAREERAGKSPSDKDPKAGTAAAPAAAAVAQAPAPAPIRAVAPRVAVRKDPEPDEELPVLTEKLEADKRKLAELEVDRERQLRDARAKFEEMKLRLTPLHPEVITQGERVAMLSQVPSDVAQLRAEVADIERDIKQRKFVNQGAVSGFGGAVGTLGTIKAAGQSNAEPLPTEITQLLDRDNLDPALVAQLSGTVMKYGALRDELLSARIELDTAQAAFNHRYQLIVPAEVPGKPIKPKPEVIVAAGLALSLLLALFLPVALQLRTGIMIERWQVQAMALPVLAELHLPPYSSE